MTLPASITALPCWSGTPSGTPLHGGLSNAIWRVTDAVGDHVVRLGRDYPFHHVDRAREVMVARAAHAAGFAPAVEYSAPGVMVTQFLTARTWSAEDLRADPARVAVLLRRFHEEMPRRAEGAAFLFWPFHVIRDYLRQLSPGDGAAPIAAWQALNNALESVQPPLPLVFGHHDLLPANILDDGQRLWLIDYEYAGFGTCLFDLAGAASNAGMTAEQARALLAAYLGRAPDAALTRAFDAMQVASLLRETLWALVSARHLAAPGVDYAAYAADNAARLAAALDLYQTTHGKIAP
jgi:thiamine kinase-like enzyme